MLSKADFLGPGPANATFAGELSFLRRRYTRDISHTDVVVTGIPLDLATTYRPGARLGPRAIRAASVQLAEIAERAYPYAIDPFATLAVADYGDCLIEAGLPADPTARIESHIREILAHNVKLMCFGGDHFITYPALKVHAEKYGPLSMVHFDAHVDTWEDDGQHSDHGTMFLRALREGLIDPSRSVQVGIRSFAQADHGFHVFDAETVAQRGPQAILAAILEIVGIHPTYLTFDIDCLDPAFAPGTGTPVAGGLSTLDALTIVRGLTPANLVGWDVVEVAPAYDHAEITAIAAATIAHDLICQEALRRHASG